MDLSRRHLANWSHAMLPTKRLHVVAPLLLICSTAVAQAKDKPTGLFKFGKPNAAKQWQTVNDGVMGGVSDGQFRITDKGTMEFFGELCPTVIAQPHIAYRLRQIFKDVRSRLGALRISIEKKLL